MASIWDRLGFAAINAVGQGGPLQERIRQQTRSDELAKQRASREEWGFDKYKKPKFNADGVFETYSDDTDNMRRDEPIQRGLAPDAFRPVTPRVAQQAEQAPQQIQSPIIPKESRQADLEKKKAAMGMVSSRIAAQDAIANKRVEAEIAKQNGEQAPAEKSGKVVVDDGTTQKTVFDTEQQQSQVDPRGPSAFMRKRMTELATSPSLNKPSNAVTVHPETYKVMDMMAAGVPFGRAAMVLEGRIGRALNKDERDMLSGVYRQEEISNRQNASQVFRSNIEAKRVQNQYGKENRKNQKEVEESRKFAKTVKTLANRGDTNGVIGKIRTSLIRIDQAANSVSNLDIKTTGLLEDFVSRSEQFINTQAGKGLTEENKAFVISLADDYLKLSQDVANQRKRELKENYAYEMEEFGIPPEEAAQNADRFIGKIEVKKPPNKRVLIQKIQNQKNKQLQNLKDAGLKGSEYRRAAMILERTAEDEINSLEEEGDEEAAE